MMNRSIICLAVVVVAACAPKVELKSMPPHPTTAELRAMLDSGEITSVAVVTEILGRTRRFEALNAVITLDSAGALARAKELDEMRANNTVIGPLHGIPFVVKDNIHVAGLRNTAGTPAMADFIPAEDNTVITALRDAGAIVLAKTNLHELAFGITSDNAAYGAVANPFDPSTFAGGSSGGTASAVSAGIVSAGLGTDTGGSVRIPAALTGVVGFRPSIGRYDSSAVTPISGTRDTIGIIARSVSDILVFDSAIYKHSATGTDIEPAEIRLGVPRSYYFANLDEDAAIVVEGALAKLADAGVTLVNADPGDIQPLLDRSGFAIALYEAHRDLPRYLESYSVGASLSELASAIASPDVKAIIGSLVGDSPISTDDYEGALAAREELRDSYKKYFAEHKLDAMIFPTTLLPARPIENSLETVLLNGKQVATFPTYIHNTDPASIAALPGISLPIGLAKNGLPVGIELDGPEQADDRLLDVAAALEEVIGFDARATTGQ